MTRALVILAGFLGFALAATLNSGGYRYGASDQAFYIPAILRDVDPQLFPRDATLIESQARLFVLDELFARLLEIIPLPLETWFLAGYAITLALLFVALVRFGATFFTSSWSIAAFAAAATLRHRIAKTGANTLEGYFHPRQLAFAIGVFALIAVMRRRPWIALALVVLSGIVHPTTALCFGAWAAIALFVEVPRLRPALAALAGAAILTGMVLIAAGVVTLAKMDPLWVATIADKDYVFPNEWSASVWALNLLYPVVIAVTFLARRRRGLVRDGELGIVVGCLALVALFLASMPLIAAHIAIAVQLQISRVFWMADLLAVLCAIWWLTEAPRSVPASETGGPARPATARPAIVFATLALFAFVRGTYVLKVEHPGRPLLQTSLPTDPWRDIGAWLRRATPRDAHVLADPDHAWRFGSSLRVSAGRDVFLENVKDGSIAMYDRGVAQRVAERRTTLGDFAALRPDTLRALAARYDLDLVVSERRLPLPEAYRNERFHVYRLTP